MVACGPTEDDGGGATVVAIEISPPDAERVILNGVVDPVDYTATVVYDDDSRVEITDSAFFEIDNGQLGSFAAASFQPGGASAGVGVVTGSFEGLSATASVTIRIQTDRANPDAPADSADLFDNATEDSAQAPVIVYPAANSFVPPNLGDFETHWTDASANDLFRVRISTEFTQTTVYTRGTIEAAGLWQAFLPSEWAPAGNAARGAPMDVSVAGLSTAAPATFGQAALSIGLAEEDTDGGIYYWASTGAQPSGIYRHDMSRPGEPAEAFYTTGETPNNRCVACHVISRDGTTMAITFDGGNTSGNAAEAGVIDIATSTLTSPLDGSMKWNFAAFTPDGSELLTVLEGVMTMRNPVTAAAISVVPTTGYATHPEFNPAGDRLVYVVAAAPTQDWIFTGGSIVVQDYSPTLGFGAPTTIATSGAANYYYPSWSPDGEWIVFNSSTEDSYDDGSAELFIVSATGLGSPPTKLDSPNISAGLTNSWARFAPFAQQQDGEALHWLTFSSKRAFGVRLAAGRPQIWMAPLFPERLGVGDPSGPAFRLPFQEIGTNNHIAQWTEKIVIVE